MRAADHVSSTPLGRSRGYSTGYVLLTKPSSVGWQRCPQKRGTVQPEPVRSGRGQVAGGPPQVLPSRLSRNLPPGEGDEEQVVGSGWGEADWPLG